MAKFFVRDTGCGEFLEFDTAAEASVECNKRLESYRQTASETGEWPDDVEALCWGRISFKAIGEEREVDDAEAFDEPPIDYQMQMT